MKRMAIVVWVIGAYGLMLPQGALADGTLVGCHSASGASLPLCVCENTCTPTNAAPSGTNPIVNGIGGAAFGIGQAIGNALFGNNGNSAQQQAIRQQQQAIRQQQLQAQQRQLREQQRQAALKAAEERRRKAEAFANQKAGLLQGLTGVQNSLGMARPTEGFPQLHRQAPFQQGWTNTPWLDRMQRELSANESPPPATPHSLQQKTPLSRPPASQPVAFPKQRLDSPIRSRSVVDLSGKQGIVDPADLKKDNPNYNHDLPLSTPVPAPETPRAQPSWFDRINKALNQDQHPASAQMNATRG